MSSVCTSHSVGNPGDAECTSATSGRISMVVLQATPDGHTEHTRKNNNVPPSLRV